MTAIEEPVAIDGAKLEEGERVPGRGAVQAVSDVLRDRAYERRCRVSVEAADLKRGQVGAVQERRLALADAQDRGEGLGEEPAEREEQRLGARTVEGMSVVDEHERRRRLGLRREQAERRGADREPLAHRARTERERAFERRCLRRRNPVEQPERGAEELEQPRERDVRLRVDPPGAEDL